MNEKVQVEGFLRPPYAILAGAGISMLPPASLPSAWKLIKAVISDPLLPLTESERSMLLEATSADWKDGLGAYHFLRFEQLVEALGQTIDPNLTSLSSLIPASVPNEYHYSLATLVKRGHKVLTTNFDTLIEEAGRALGIEIRVVVTERDYFEYNSHPEKFPFPLFKIHGSFVKRKSPDLRQDLVTESTLIGAGINVSHFKWSVVRKILDSSDLMVVGYSGYDDFDVMPVISSSGRGRRLYWSHYKPQGDGELFIGNSWPRHKAPGFHFHYATRKAFFDRLSGAVRAERDVILSMENSIDSIRALLKLNLPSRFLEQRSQACTAPLSVSWERPEFMGLLAARLLQHVGSYDRSIELLDDFLKVGGNSLCEARAHLWLAEIAADRHRDAEAHDHLLGAMAIIKSVPNSTLLLGDLVAILGFPVSDIIMTYEMALPRQWLANRVVGIPEDLSHSLSALSFGFGCVGGVRRCVENKRYDELARLLKVFNESELRAFQPEEVLADIRYWMAVAEFDRAIEEGSEEVAAMRINRAAALADQSCRVFERLQRRRKFIDAALLMAICEAWEGRHDWAKGSAEEVRAFSELVGSDYGVSQADSLLKALLL